MKSKISTGNVKVVTVIVTNCRSRMESLTGLANATLHPLQSSIITGNYIVFRGNFLWKWNWKLDSLCKTLHLYITFEYYFPGNHDDQIWDVKAGVRQNISSHRLTRKENIAAVPDSAAGFSPGFPVGCHLVFQGIFWYGRYITGWSRLQFRGTSAHFLIFSRAKDSTRG